MILTPALRTLALVIPLGLGAAAACSSDDSRKTSASAAGAGGEDSAQSGGAPGAGRGGADAGQAGGQAGAPGSAGAVNGGAPGSAGAVNGGAPGSAGEAGASPAGASNGGVGGSDDGGADPIVVSSYGCFALSGDDSETQVSGEPGVVVTSSPHGATCEGSKWVSDNENAYAPAEVPNTLRFRRSFVLAQAVAGGAVSISFKADDAVSFVLNGQAIGGCEPTAGDIGLCQQACIKLPLSAGLLLEQQTNVLDIELINLQSASTGDGNFGWTAVSYALCVAPPS